MPSVERIVEIFTHTDEAGCKIYWNQVTSKEPSVNITNSTIHGKGTKRAIIMGQLFVDKAEEKCTWYTPSEYIFNRSVQCQSVNMDRNKCAEIRWYTPKLLMAGTHSFPLDIYMISANGSIYAIVTMGTQVINITVKCRSVIRKHAGFGRQSPYCKGVEEDYTWACLANMTIKVTPLDTGEWAVYGPHETWWYQQNTVVGAPKIHKGGPVVVGRQLRRKLLINPQYALTHLLIDLDIRIDTVMPICNRYTSTLRKGWEEWIKSIDGSLRRRKRDLTGTILGGVGAGLGTINTIDVEILASKLGRVGTELNTLKHPLGTSLNE